MSDDRRFGRLEELPSGVRLGQFVSVGALGFLVDNAVLALLIEVAGLGVVLGKPVSAEAAIVVMFVANERWTFAEWGRVGVGPLLRRFATSNVVRVGGAAVAWAVLVALTELYGVHYFVGNTIGIGVGVVVNYVAESLVTWRVGVQR